MTDTEETSAAECLATMDEDTLDLVLARWCCELPEQNEIEPEETK